MITKIVQYIKQTRPLIEVSWGIGMPDKIKEYIKYTYYDTGILFKIVITENNGLSQTSILMFDSEINLYRYNTDPVLAEWRKESNLHLLREMITSVQMAGIHEFTDEYLSSINHI